MKTGLLFLSILFAYTLHAEVYKQAAVIVPTKGYKIGDTVKVYGVYEMSNGKEKYIVRQSNLQSYKYANGNYFELLESELGFWDELYFNERAVLNLRKHPKKELYNKLYKKEKEVLGFCSENNLLEIDEITEDYLRGLMMKVYTSAGSMPVENIPKVYLVDNMKPLRGSFGSDKFFITTGYIVEKESEAALVHGLAELKAHNVLQHDLINLQKKEKEGAVVKAVCCLLSAGMVVAVIASAANDSDDDYDDYESNSYSTEVYYEDDNGPVEVYGGLENVLLPDEKKYDLEQRLEASKYAQQFVNNFLVNEIGHSKRDYYKTIGGAITKKAWTHYHRKEYEMALHEVERLFEADVAVEEDYLLKCKLFRMKYASEDKMYEILDLIATAKSLGVNPLVDFDKEAALVYARLVDKENELKSYELYQKGLLALKNMGDEVGEELKEVNEAIYKLRLP